MIDIVCGARPNFMKVAPILRSLPEGVRARLVHTGQHYDYRMSQAFFDDLGLPEPDLNLEVGSASVTRQTAMVMERYEEVLGGREKPEAAVVVGDVNSTLACSLVAARFGIPVVHVEAGLRSFDRTMPEEINRILTDQLSDLLLITSPEARRNLLAEARPPDAILMVGNPMIDTLLGLLPRAVEEHPAPRDRYGLVTLHRPSNVDEPGRLSAILEELGVLRETRFLFPVHPRTMKGIEAWGLASRVPPNVELMEPMGYLEFISLEKSASVVITDSGGIQEETTVLGVPCVTVRGNTERPITVTAGTNVLCPDPSGLARAVAERIAAKPASPPSIPFWDGSAGPRIASAIRSFLECRR